MASRPTTPLLRTIAPAITAFVALLLVMAPAGGFAGWTGPQYLLIALAFWSMRRPEATPALLVFALGFLHDLLRDGPIGAELFALLLACQALSSLERRRPVLNRLQETVRFAGAAVLFNFVVWALLYLSYAEGASIRDLVERTLLSIALYPFIAYGLERLTGARAGEGRFEHLAPRGYN